LLRLEKERGVDCVLTLTKNRAYGSGMRYRLAVIAVLSVFALTSCSSSNNAFGTNTNKGGFGTNTNKGGFGTNTNKGWRNTDTRTNKKKLSDFDKCISGGLGRNAVEIKKTIDSCTSRHLIP